MKKEILIINDMDDFMKEISSIVREIIKEELHSPRLKAKEKMNENVYLTASELGQHLHISKTTVYRYVNSGVFTCHKVGRRSLFNLKEVEAALIKVNV